MTISEDLLATLRGIDTPTVCNALELVDPALRIKGFNRRPLICPFPDHQAVVGFARTAIIRCSRPDSKGGPAQRQLRLGYYEHVEKGARPSIAVIEDADESEPGLGAFWGEVQTNIHHALGCLGVITNGSVRDIPQMAPGFFVLAGSIMPSHVHADVIDFACPVTVCGMAVKPDDLIHADRHGAVVIPADAASSVPAAAAVLTRREKILLDASKAPGFSTDTIRKAFEQMNEIH
jgi:regulator of RNase E activity RraA